MNDAHRIINLIRFPQFIVTIRDRFKCEKMPKYCAQSLTEIQRKRLKLGPVKIQQWNIWNGLRNKNKNATDATIIIFCECFFWWVYTLFVCIVHSSPIVLCQKRYPKKTFNFGIFNLTNCYKYIVSNQTSQKKTFEEEK